MSGGVGTQGRPARGPELREFRWSDEEAVVALWGRCDLLRPWNDPRKDLRRKLAVDTGPLLVAVVEGQIVGTVMAGYDGHRGWINYLAVEPEARRRGLGAHLMRAAEEALLARGCPKVNLQVRSGNEAAVAFYLALGYGEDATRSFGKRLVVDDVGLPDDSARADVPADPAIAAAPEDSAAAGVSTAAAMPTRDSVVSLRELDANNVLTVARLTVAPAQRRFVAGNGTSLAEALVSEHAWYRAIYADETPVGFCMIHEDLARPVYYLWRFMIDARYQGLGFGRAALLQLIERGASLSRVEEMLLSVVEGEGSPRAFYEALGFVSTGRYDDGELVLALPLKPPAGATRVAPAD